MCTRYLGFKNNYLALVVPMLFSVWQMILAKNFMKGGIPFEIIESAKVDGANDFTIYWKLVIPLAKPLIATLSLFAAADFLERLVQLYVVHEQEQHEEPAILPA